MLDSYATIREQIIAAFDALNDLAARRSSDRVLVSSSAAKERLEENRFNLVVFGEFKRGKSTFINSLLGKSVLPTAVVPLTSVITLVRYGEQERATIHFKDGRALDALGVRKAIVFVGYGLSAIGRFGLAFAGSRGICFESAPR